MATVDFGTTKGLSNILSLGPPNYDLTIAGPANVSMRLETVVIPHMAGELLVGDGLQSAATLEVSGKIFLGTRSALAAAVTGIWKALAGAGSHWVMMSDCTYNYPVLFKNCSGEHVRDSGGKWGNLTITLLILDPSDIAT